MQPTTQKAEKYSIKDVETLLSSIGVVTSEQEQAVCKALDYNEGYISQLRSREKDTGAKQVSPKFFKQVAAFVRSTLQNAKNDTAHGTFVPALAVLGSQGVNITLQDYLDLQKQMIQQLNEDKEKLYGIINSGLAKISKDQQYALAYQKAWVDREAEKESGGDKQKKNQIKAKMGKLVDGFLPPDEKADSQSQ